MDGDFKMAKRIVILLIIVMAAVALDLLRQEVFAWMGAGEARKTTSQNSIEFASWRPSLPVKSGIAASSGLGGYPPPRGQNSRLFLPSISKP
jgi:hypothetical protein